MATIRMTGAAVLGTVVEAAEAINDVINSVSTGARMLNRSIEHAAFKQQTNMKLDRKYYEEHVINTKMLEIDQLREKSVSYMSENEQRRERCERIYEELKAALAA